MARYEAFEKLASQEVGKVGSKFVFVSLNHECVAVFRKGDGLTVAKVQDFAESLGEAFPVVVEDSGGITWENECSEEEQARLAEEEGD